jgi:hypothetical protein
MRRLRACLHPYLRGGAPLSVTFAKMIPTNAILVFPADPDLRQLSGRRVPLTLTTEHRLSRNGHPIILDGDGEFISAEAFRRMRTKLGAWIETDNTASVRAALCVPEDEPGIIGVKKPDPPKAPLTL